MAAPIAGFKIPGPDALAGPPFLGGSVQCFHSHAFPFLQITGGSFHGSWNLQGMLDLSKRLERSEDTEALEAEALDDWPELPRLPFGHLLA